jgi:DNA-binding LacI/PurR family transcriptional regulator
VFSFDLTDEEGARLDDLGMPVVYVSQHADGRASVYVDDVAGARNGTRHLLNLGHRRIAFVQGTGATGFSFSSHERLLGHQQALAEAGIPRDDSLVAAAEPGDERAVAEALGRLLSLREPPTAVFAEQDELAVRLVRALRRSRIEVPERMSVLGFDDQPVAEWFDLSTVAQSPSEMGRVAGELVLELINDPDADHKRHVVLPTCLIPRATTAPIPAPRTDPAAGESR